MPEPDPTVLALLKRLVSVGVLDMDDISAIASDLPADAAHDVRLAGMSAIIGGAVSAADHDATVRRKSLRLVDPDGGN
jgi:hypothetical protein